MSIASKISERFRNRITRLVAKQRAELGCATLAVKRVASKLHMSPATIYRIMNGYGEVRVEARHYVAVLMLSFGASAKKAASKFSVSRKSHRSELRA